MELELTRGLYIACLKTSTHFGIIWFKEKLTKSLTRRRIDRLDTWGDYRNPALPKDIIYVNIYERPNRMGVWIPVANSENSKRTVGD